MIDACFEIKVTGQLNRNGMPNEALKEHMIRTVSHAIGLGLVTGDSQAQVEDYEIKPTLLPVTPVTMFYLTITGRLCLNGESKEDLADRLDRDTEHYIDLGLLTGGTAAEVIDHDLRVRVARTAGWGRLSTSRLSHQETASSQ